MRCFLKLDEAKIMKNKRGFKVFFHQDSGKKNGAMRSMSHCPIVVKLQMK